MRHLACLSKGSLPRSTASIMRAGSVCVAPRSVRRSWAVRLFTPIDSLNGTVALHLDPLQFPHGKAPDVDVELVQSGIVAIVRELNFELQLVASYGLLAHRTWGPDAWPAPCAIRPTSRELSGLDYCSGFCSEDRFVRQLRSSNYTHETDARRSAGIIKPDPRAGRRSRPLKGQWKADVTLLLSHLVVCRVPHTATSKTRITTQALPVCIEGMARRLRFPLAPSGPPPRTARLVRRLAMVRVS